MSFTLPTNIILQDLKNEHDFNVFSPSQISTQSSLSTKNDELNFVKMGHLCYSYLKSTLVSSITYRFHVANLSIGLRPWPGTIRQRVTQ